MMFFLALFEAENQNNTYVKCQMTQARRASRADPEDGELRGKIISEILGQERICL